MEPLGLHFAVPSGILTSAPPWVLTISLSPAMASHAHSPAPKDQHLCSTHGKSPTLGDCVTSTENWNEQAHPSQKIALILSAILSVIFPTQPDAFPPFPTRE